MPFIANTDWNWFSFFRARVKSGAVIDEANFWQPKAQKPMANLAPGTPVFFRLKSPRNVLAGYGFYSHFILLGLQQAWSLFGPANGDENLESFYSRIGRYRGVDLLGDPGARRDPLGCTILRDCTFWPQERWLTWGEGEGWAPNIVQGKTERDELRASRLLAEIHRDAMAVPGDLDSAAFVPVEIDSRELILASQRERVGQGAFRSRMLGTYARRCAITGEHTEVVLDAAHIQPYLGPSSNHVQNGMLLTKEFHALFDAGYVTVTPDYKVRVSDRLREEWHNGHRYYPFDGSRLAVLPDESRRPSQRALEWHGAQVFLD